MRTHVQIIGWLYVIFGGLAVFGALIYALIGVGLAAIFQTEQISSDLARDGVSPDAAAAVAVGVGVVLACVVVLFALPQIIAGIGLLRMRPWARILGIIVSILYLPGFPLGTALGVYTLVIMFNDETVALFQSSAETAKAAGPPGVL